MTTTTKQNMIAVSITSKTFVADTAASFGAPSKSKPFMLAKETEVVEAMVAFIESTRYVTRPVVSPVMVEEMDDEGNLCLVDSGEVVTEQVEFDAFGEALQAVLAARMDTVRTNSAAAKVASLESTMAAQAAELAALRAELAARMGIA